MTSNFGKIFFDARYFRVYFTIKYEAEIPAANSNLSEITTGISEFQTAAGKLNAQIQAAPPTE